MTLVKGLYSIDRLRQNHHPATMATTVPAMRTRNKNVRPTPRPTLLDFPLLCAGTGAREGATVRVGVVGVMTVGDRVKMAIDSEGVNSAEDDIDGPGVSEDGGMDEGGTMEDEGGIMVVVTPRNDTIMDVVGGSIMDVVGGAIMDVVGGSIMDVVGGAIMDVVGGAIMDVVGGAITDVLGSTNDTVTVVAARAPGDESDIVGVSSSTETVEVVVSSAATAATQTARNTTEADAMLSPRRAWEWREGMYIRQMLLRAVNRVETHTFSMERWQRTEKRQFTVELELSQ